jgi:hypothetical protein
MTILLSAAQRKSLVGLNLPGLTAIRQADDGTLHVAHVPDGRCWDLDFTGRSTPTRKDPDA